MRLTLDLLILNPFFFVFGASMSVLVPLYKFEKNDYTRKNVFKFRTSNLKILRIKRGIWDGIKRKGYKIGVGYIKHGDFEHADTPDPIIVSRSNFGLRLFVVVQTICGDHGNNYVVVMEWM